MPPPRVYDDGITRDAVEPSTIYCVLYTAVSYLLLRQPEPLQACAAGQATVPAVACLQLEFDFEFDLVGRLERNRDCADVCIALGHKRRQLYAEWLGHKLRHWRVRWTRARPDSGQFATHGFF